MGQVDSVEFSIRCIVGGAHHHDVADDRFGRELGFDSLGNDLGLQCSGRMPIRDVHRPKVVLAPAVSEAQHDPAAVSGKRAIRDPLRL